MSRNLTVINRLTRKTEELNPSQRRRIRKYEGKAFMSGVFPNFRLHLPYYASSINRLFPYRPAVTDQMMVNPTAQPTAIPTADIETAEVPSTTTPIAAPAAAPAAKPTKAKVTMELARKIRAFSNMPANAIAKQFGLGETTVRDILKGKTWKEPATA